MSNSIHLTDPGYVKNANPGFLYRRAAELLCDERDVPMVKLALTLFVLFVPPALYFLSNTHFDIWLALPYLALNFLGFLGPYTLMLHNICHRPLFKKEHRWMGSVIFWVLGPLFGQTPETYYAHHIGMHHFENNLKGDLSSTLRYQRDRPAHFARYFFRFLFLGVGELGGYLWSHRRKKLFRRIMIGEALYFSTIAVLLALNWKGTLVVFVVPLLTVRFAMMAGNWAQHAFVDHNDPGNNYRNSITCINSTYNRRCFNDGYHIGHHIKMNRHWSEMPEDFLMNIESYRKERAIIFEGLDYFMVWLFLMRGRFDKLAEHFVDLDDVKKSKTQVIALLKSRVSPVRLEGSGLS